MAGVLVTGGTGALGREVVARLLRRGLPVRILSRRASPPVPKGVRTIWGDLAGSPSLAAAVAGIETVVHCASSPVRRTRAVDVEGTERLLDAAKAAGVRHFLYISIVGIDRVPFGYYRAKLEAERRIEAAAVPWTILRATQFHSLLVQVFSRLARIPALVVPKGFRFQPCDEGEVADALVDLLGKGPAGRAPDFGGPEVRGVVDLARSFLAASGSRRPVWPIGIPGKTAAAFRAGGNLCPERAAGTVRWEAYLEARRAAP